MKEKDSHIYLNDILDSINSGLSFIEGITFEEFIQDNKTQFALIRAIEIVGETSKKISNEIKEQSKEIPWREIAGMRDILIHDYFGINEEVVWKTAKEDLPELKDKIEELIKTL